MPWFIRNVVLAAGLSFALSAAAAIDFFPASGPIVRGSAAVLRGRDAAAPSAAPLAVKRAIWAANQLRGKRYRYGGGHRSFRDSAYDCSGTVSYALAAAGLVSMPLNSSDLRNYGTRGEGKWITIYARNGHAFAVIAGLRLDTTAWNDSSRRHAPRWQPMPRKMTGFEVRHPPGL